MDGINLTVDHNGHTYGGTIMKIKKTSLGLEDHGIVTAFLHCESGHLNVGVGGYCLDKSEVVGTNERGHEERERVGTAYGLDHIMRLCQTVGVDNWEDIPGNLVIVLWDEPGFGWGQSAVGIANVLDRDKIFILKDHANAWRNKED